MSIRILDRILVICHLLRIQKKRILLQLIPLKGLTCIWSFVTSKGNLNSLWLKNPLLQLISWKWMVFTLLIFRLLKVLILNLLKSLKLMILKSAFKKCNDTRICSWIPVQNMALLGHFRQLLGNLVLRLFIRRLKTYRRVL